MVRSRVTGTGSRRAAAILVLGLLLLGALAGASSQANRGTSTLRAGAASDALSVALTLGVLLLAATSAILTWALLSRGRGTGDADERERTPLRHRLAACAILGLLVAVVVALLRKRLHPVQGALTPIGIARAQVRPPGKSAIHFIPAASISTLGLVAVVLAILFAWSSLSTRRHRRRWSLSEFIFGTNAVIPIAPTESLAESLATVRVPDPEEETDPRKAVVAAYLAMTHAAAVAGARRRDDETPSEFLQRLLDSLGASHEAARRLTLLFETARYSSKVFEETRRSEAITALRQIRAELSPGTVGAAP